MMLDNKMGSIEPILLFTSCQICGIIFTYH
ncbi:hypothetical protein BRC2024_QFGIOCBO_CDS_0033 [Acinetobacter phage vB_AbaM_PhT2-v2]